VSKREQNSAEESRIEGAAEQPVSPRKRGRRRKGLCLEDRPMLEANAAGIDIGAREIFVAVPPDRDENPVRVFATFTEDLEALARWLNPNPEVEVQRTCR
jgi:hypothetical protein